MGEFITTGSKAVEAIVFGSQQQRAINQLKRREIKKNWDQLRRQQNRFSMNELIPVNLDYADSRMLYDIFPNNSWKGQRCFIIGGGESLKGFDFSILRNELTIGINRAYEKIDCTINYSMDHDYYNWIITGKMGPEAKKKLDDFNGIPVWLDGAGYDYPDGVFIVHKSHNLDFSDSLKKGISGGSNSGLGALNLAVCLGANPIYLLGFDMKTNGTKQTWWHSGYPEKQKDKVYRSFVASFNHIAPEVEKRGIQVVNLNLKSGLKCFDFGDVRDIPSIRRPVITSFYTKNTGYEAQAEYLKASLRRFNYDNHIEGVPDRGDWHKNVYQKPSFIMRMMRKFPNRPIVFVDADAIIRKNPVLFNDFDCDIACHFFQDKELLSGTLYFGNTKGSRYIVRKWLDENRFHPTQHMPQKNLRIAFDKYKDKIKWEKLPSEYCRIYDSRMPMKGDPVIEHFQLSRMYKKTKTQRFRYTMQHSLEKIQLYGKGKSVCLLGNANSILNEQKDIDSYDIVCRMNRGYPQDKESYIGSKTNILFLSTGITGRSIQKKYNPSFLVWCTVCYRLASPWTLRNAIQNPQEDWDELNKKIGINPTTGMLALNFILKHIDFKSLHIYGFDFFKTKTWYNTRIDNGQKHSGRKEKELFMGMICDNPKIKFMGDDK